MPQGRRINSQIDIDGFCAMNRRKLQCKFIGILVFKAIEIFDDKDDREIDQKRVWGELS